MKEESRARIEIPKEKLAEFCRRHHIRRLALFGSVLRDDFREESHVGVLVQFEPDVRVGYHELFDLEQELSGLLGERKVDMSMPRSLSRYFRGRVFEEAEETCVAT